LTSVVVHRLMATTQQTSVYPMLSQYVRDPFSSFSHLAGALLAAIGLAFMVVKATALEHQFGLYLASYLVFGITLILMFTASAVYHWLILSEDGIRQLKRIDHIAIFAVIAGTYTPFCLISLQGTLGWWLFGVIWGIALLGIAMKIFWLHAPRFLSTVFYLAMGWACAIAIDPLSEALSEPALFWLVTGGVCYSIGAVIYALKWPNPWPEHFGFHEIWHLFVIGGAASHYFSIAHYL